MNRVVDRQMLLFDIETLVCKAKEFHPPLILAGPNGYSGNLAYCAFRKSADSAGAVSVADLAQTTALVPVGIAPSSLTHCEIVIAHHETLYEMIWFALRQVNSQRNLSQVSLNGEGSHKLLRVQLL